MLLALDSLLYFWIQICIWIKLVKFKSINMSMSLFLLLQIFLTVGSPFIFHQPNATSVQDHTESFPFQNFPDFSSYASGNFLENQRHILNSSYLPCFHRIQSRLLLPLINSEPPTHFLLSAALYNFTSPLLLSNALNPVKDLEERH